MPVKTWTAVLTSVTKQNGNVVAVVTFTASDGEVLSSTYRAATIDLGYLRSAVRDKIASLATRDTNLSDLLSLEGQQVEPADPTPPGGA